MGTEDQLSSSTIEFLLELNQSGWDIYFIPNGVSPSFCGVKPKDSDIVRHTTFVIDLDPKQGKIEYEDAARLASFVADICPPVCSVHTGNGLQLFVTDMDNSLTPKETSRRINHYLRKVKSILELSEFNDIVLLDTSTSDSSRMVRMPLTINHKTNTRGYLISQQFGIGPSFVNFSEPPPITTATPFNGNLTNLSAIAPRLTRAASEFLLDGVDSKVKSRHRAAYSAAANLHTIGVSRDVAQDWITHGASICRPPLPESEAIYCVRCAYSRNES